MKDHQQLKDQFENFLNATISARDSSRRDTDYDDHIQWTAAEEKELEKRHQAPVVINRVKRKVNLLTGIQRKMRTKPRALPRTPQHEQGADAITKGLRFVGDNVDLEQTSSMAFRKQVVWGYGGVIVEVEPTGQDFEIVVNDISPEYYYFDPHSSRLDFADKTFDGIAKWMDADQAKAFLPGNDELIDHSFIRGSENIDGLDDKPNVWVDAKRKRLRVLQHYYREKDTWMLAYFTHAGIFSNKDGEMNGPSPWRDEFGKPSNPIEMQTAYIDQENNRYGEVRSYIWLQDEINHRRSKLLYLLSVRQTKGEAGAVKDVTMMKAELAKGDGHVEYNPGMEWDILPTSDMAQGQFQIYMQSLQEIDGFSGNAALSGTGNAQSGRQEQMQQMGGISELAPLYDGHKNLEKRIYRQVFNRMKQFWDAEKWIRVTDDPSDLQWVGLNQPVTFGEQLMEQAEQGNEEAQQMLQFGLQNQDPRLNEVVETRNQIVELDLDIILTESPDFATIRQEQFAQLAELAKAYGPESVPFEVMLHLSEVIDKDEVVEMLRGDPALAKKVQDIQEMLQQLEIADKQLTVEGKQLDNEGQQIDNVQKQVETVQLANAPADSVNVNT